MRALQRKCHILSRGVSITHHVSSFPFVLAGPRVADASVMNEQKRVRFEINESKLWMARLQRTVLWSGHLFHSVSRFQHSGKVGVLVSMVLILTLFLCSYFSRFTV